MAAYVFALLAGSRLQNRMVTHKLCLHPSVVQETNEKLFQTLLTFCLQTHPHQLLGTSQHMKNVVLHQMLLILCLQAHHHQLVLPMRLLHISNATCSFLEAGLWQTALETCMC